MTDETPQRVAGEAAQQKELQRIKGILSHKEIDDHEDLASYAWSVSELRKSDASHAAELSTLRAEVKALRDIVERVANGLDEHCYVTCSEYGCGCKEDLTPLARAALSPKES